MKTIHRVGYANDRNGWVKCFACKVNDKIDAQLILLERTHHDLSTIELISKFEMRKKLGLVNGASMSIRISI